jgi:hypothetical protein
MAHTQDAVVVDATGVVHMVVIPDDDSQLADPAFNPPGHTHLRVSHNPAADPVATASALHPAMNVRMPPAHGPVVNAPAGNLSGNTTAP